MKENQFPEDNDFLEEDEYLDEALPEDEFIEDEPFEEEFIDEEPLEEEFVEDEFIEEIPEEEYPEEEFIEDEAYLPDEEIIEEAVLHDQLVPPETGDELTAADHAMYEAGLTHPEDAEFMDEPYAEEPLPEEIAAEEAEETAEGKPQRSRRERPAHKGRPRRRKGYGLLGIPQILSAAIWLLIIMAIGVSLGRLVWVCAADVLAFGRESKEVTISITTDDTMDSIAEKLEAAGLIHYKDLFLLYADLAKVEEKGKITTGTFTLNTIYDYNALVKAMSPSSGSRAVVEDVLIPEGYSCRQIFERLEEKGVCTVADLEEWAANGELGDYWFLEGIERGDRYCLEGFLFPATYDFYENSTPKQVLTKMLNAFEANFTEELQGQISVLNELLAEKMRANGESEEYIAAHAFTVREVVTVASLIEKETSGTGESSTIASVIYNRLFSWGDTPRYLNIDASIIYALDGKTDLTAEDMAVDSPYNTYTNTGLTPGPIANPGVASLKAALNPEETPYYYYVLDPEEGSHIFAKTYEEHLKNIESLG